MAGETLKVIFVGEQDLLVVLSAVEDAENFDLPVADTIEDNVVSVRHAPNYIEQRSRRYVQNPPPLRP